VLLISATDAGSGDPNFKEAACMALRALVEAKAS